MIGVLIFEQLRRVRVWDASWRSMLSTHWRRIKHAAIKHSFCRLSCHGPRNHNTAGATARLDQDLLWLCSQPKHTNLLVITNSPLLSLSLSLHLSPSTHPLSLLIHISSDSVEGYRPWCFCSDCGQMAILIFILQVFSWIAPRTLTHSYSHGGVRVGGDQSQMILAFT